MRNCAVDIPEVVVRIAPRDPVHQSTEPGLFGEFLRVGEVTLKTTLRWKYNLSITFLSQTQLRLKLLAFKRLLRQVLTSVELNAAQQDITDILTEHRARR